MPRQARIDFPGALHHVIVSAIEKKPIFALEKYKHEIFTRLKNLLKKSSMECYAWSIMDNHLHLLLLTGKTSLAEIMRRLLTGYALYYNKERKRAGHLFQNRYKSILCDSDDYLLPLIRYIHLNPVRVKKVVFTGLRRYPWTGHNEIMDRNKKERIIARDEVLSYFGKTESMAAKAYDEYIEDGIGQSEDYRGGGLIRSGGGLQAVLCQSRDEREMYDERILGDGGFVESVYNRLDIEDGLKTKIKDINKLLKRISDYYDISKVDLLQSWSKKVREARSVAIYISYKYMGLTITKIGKIFGIKQSGASSAMYRGKTLCANGKIEEKLIK